MRKKPEIIYTPFRELKMPEKRPDRFGSVKEFAAVLAVLTALMVLASLPDIIFEVVGF